MMATALYDRMVAFNYEDDERAALMRKVWDPTPWMVDAYTGNYVDGREREMLLWCFDTFGDQASPIHEKPGTWLRGSATVDGWTWFGFATEADMDRFVARWPAPEGVKHPEAA
jgi:hypothetical protein